MAIASLLACHGATWRLSCSHLCCTSVTTFPLIDLGGGRSLSSAAGVVEHGNLILHDATASANLRPSRSKRSGAARGESSRVYRLEAAAASAGVISTFSTFLRQDAHASWFDHVAELPDELRRQVEQVSCVAVVPLSVPNPREVLARRRRHEDDHALGLPGDDGLGLADQVPCIPRSGAHPVEGRECARAVARRTKNSDENSWKGGAGKGRR